MTEWLHFLSFFLSYHYHHHHHMVFQISLSLTFLLMMISLSYQLTLNIRHMVVNFHGTRVYLKRPRTWNMWQGMGEKWGIGRVKAGAEAQKWGQGEPRVAKEQLWVLHTVWEGSQRESSSVTLGLPLPIKLRPIVIGTLTKKIKMKSLVISFLPKTSLLVQVSSSNKSSSQNNSKINVLWSIWLFTFCKC